MITNPIDKLNLLGVHFQDVHTQNESLGKPQLNNTIKEKIDLLKQEINTDLSNNSSVCNFSSTNTSDNPNDSVVPQNYFTNFTSLQLKFAKLNNKKSSSFDGIPNIALKKLPLNYIYYFAIIFNNCLNIAYFPSAWKTAKLITIKKKDKDGSQLSSYRPISLLPNISKVFETLIITTALRITSSPITNLDSVTNTRRSTQSRNSPPKFAGLETQATA